MMHCDVCFNNSPDGATVCAVCKLPLKAAEPVRESPRGHTTTKLEVQPAQQPPQLRNPDMASATHGWFPDAFVAPEADRRVTAYAPGIHAAGDPSARAAAAQQSPSLGARKIVGVLVTYTWSDRGQIFPVLEGRNRIGSDPNRCEIAIPQDDTLSAVNSHILFRTNFLIGDEVSMSGTDVDGKPVETPLFPLRNYARIRTGSTHWIFIAIQPAAA